MNVSVSLSGLLARLTTSSPCKRAFGSVVLRVIDGVMSMRGMFILGLNVCVSRSMGSTALRRQGFVSI